MAVNIQANDLPLKRTKIVSTVGPACCELETLKEMTLSGTDIFRLNFSHGTHEDHRKIISNIVQTNKELGAHVGILQDLQGTKIRIDEVEGGSVLLHPDQEFYISTRPQMGTPKGVSTPYIDIVRDVGVGDPILIDDGKIKLRTLRVERDKVITQVVYGSTLLSRKGINLPRSILSAPSMTEKDIKDLKFGFDFDIDWVALSFVRTAANIRELRALLQKGGKSTKIVAKIEKPEALDNADEIIEEADAIMVARGDLGVEIALEKVPLVQKDLVAHCNRKGKPVIIATQMLESMIESPRPTRAETNDVANAVLDGADALMLSAESASGKFPLQSVASMSKTIRTVEALSKDLYHHRFDDLEESNAESDYLIQAACHLSESIHAKAIVATTKSGYTGYRLSMHRPESPIFLFTYNHRMLTQLNLLWGIRGFFYEGTKHIEQTLEEIEQILKDQGYLTKGDCYINVSTMPLHRKGYTNMVRISYVS